MTVLKKVLSLGNLTMPNIAQFTFSLCSKLIIGVCKRQATWDIFFKKTDFVWFYNCFYVKQQQPIILHSICAVECWLPFGHNRGKSQCDLIYFEFKPSN